MRILYVSLVLAAAAGDVAAARWIPIVEGAARAIYLDSAGAIREGSQVRAWTREVYTQEQRSEQVGVFYYSANSLVSYDCAQRTWVALFKVFYGGDGTELRRVALDAVEPPALAAPGSMQEGLLERVCAPATKAASKEEPARAAGPRKAAAQPAASAAMNSTPAAAPGSVAGSAASPPEENKRQQPAVKDASAVPGAPESAKPQLAAGVEPAKAAEEPVRKVVDATTGTAPRPPYVKPAAPVRVAARQAKRTGAAREPAVEAAAGVSKPEPVHWSYAGAGSPERWAELDPQFAACAGGRRQSPIDIKDGARLELEPIRFDYRAGPLRIVDNGHTVQVNYAEGSSMVVAGERYELKQFHFHKPAEERIDGRAFDLAAHLVHQGLDGRLAVVTVLFEARQQANAFLRGLWPHLPLEQGREIAPSEATVDASALLPEVRTYFTYMGSLTTPPCTEGVLWVVLKTPVEMAPEQLAVFGKLYTTNARPLQPAHGRLIKESM